MAHRIIGDVVRFTLAYNPGAAFSMSLGQYSRFIFGVFAMVALVVLYRLYRMTGSASRDGDIMRIFALGLAWGGAAGNLIDRLRSPQGVVDFIDIGVGDVRFWTFNVADSAVTVGALALAWALSREDEASRQAPPIPIVISPEPPPAEGPVADSPVGWEALGSERNG